MQMRIIGSIWGVCGLIAAIYVAIQDRAGLARGEFSSFTGIALPVCLALSGGGLWLARHFTALTVAVFVFSFSQLAALLVNANWILFLYVKKEFGLYHLLLPAISIAQIYSGCVVFYSWAKMTAHRSPRPAA